MKKELTALGMLMYLLNSCASQQPVDYKPNTSIADKVSIAEESTDKPAPVRSDKPYGPQNRILTKEEMREQRFKGIVNGYRQAKILQKNAREMRRILQKGPHRSEDREFTQHTAQMYQMLGMYGCIEGANLVDNLEKIFSKHPKLIDELGDDNTSFERFKSLDTQMRKILKGFRQYNHQKTIPYSGK